MVGEIVPSTSLLSSLKLPLRWVLLLLLFWLLSLLLSSSLSSSLPLLLLLLSVMAATAASLLPLLSLLLLFALRVRTGEFARGGGAGVGTSLVEVWEVNEDDLPRDCSSGDAIEGVEGDEEKAGKEDGGEEEEDAEEGDKVGEEDRDKSPDFDLCNSTSEEGASGEIGEGEAADGAEGASTEIGEVAMYPARLFLRFRELLLTLSPPSSSLLSDSLRKSSLLWSFSSSNKLSYSSRSSFVMERKKGVS
mmetsp:Transcript_27608/g.42871  ORF Transcript_27608/g.42871 Transcript_27608/m.42871 type:complete len:248 (+) Transcript_27608:49-792(+)